MARLPLASDRWADAPTQLVSSRLEQGARLGSTPSNSIDSTSSSLRRPEISHRTLSDSSSSANRQAARLERTESVMSTASASSDMSTAATIAKASTATIRKLQRNDDASAKAIRFAKPKKDPDSITPSSSNDHMSNHSTDAAENHSSPISLADQSHSTVTDSFDTTVRTPADLPSHPGLVTFDHQSDHTLRSGITLDLVDEPKSFFSDSLSTIDSSQSKSASTSSRPAPLYPESTVTRPGSHRGSDHAYSELATSISCSSSYQSAVSSLNPSTDLFPLVFHSQRSLGPSPLSINKPPHPAKVGLGIQTQVPPQLTDASIPTSRYLAGSSLEVVPEARESPYMGSRASHATSTPDANQQSLLSISTALPHNIEPVWGESHSAYNSVSTDRDLGAMSSFSFPRSGSSSVGLTSTSGRPSQSASLSANFPLSPGSAFHSSNASIQSPHPLSSKTSDTGLLHASSWSYVPPSSYAGSNISSTGATSALGFTSLNATNREDMLHRILLDQARVDCQEYGTLSLEHVAEAKRDLKHVERKVDSLRTKLKVEIKIRDAAVALRKAHRTTAASAHSPASSINLAVSPTLTGFANASTSGGNFASNSSSSTTSFAAQSRALSISASEAKADEDVNVATAKVDKVANELFKWTDRANTLRRKLLEHQAATLSERVQRLESDRQLMEERLPSLTTSASFESLAPSASASAVGLTRYRDTGYRHQPSADDPYLPKGPDNPLRHNRLESDVSAISGSSFLGAAASEKVRRLAEELEKKRDMVHKLETDLESVRDAARRKDETSDRLTQQLEEQSRERSHAITELRTLKQQLSLQEEVARQTQIRAIHAATADVEERMHRQFEQSRSRDHEKEDALVNAKAEMVASQRALVDLQSRLDASQNEIKALQARAQAAEKASEEHKRQLDRVRDESTQHLAQGTQDLSSLQAKFDTVIAEQDKTNALAAKRAQTIVELENQLNQARDAFTADKASLIAEHAAAIAVHQGQLAQARRDLSGKTQEHADAEKQITASQQRIVETQARAEQAEGKLRELELAVGAERRIMAERDELFHAFERRLETAEKRLQDQDKRCARMLGKLEGREEMDDLLERIKAGAAGVSKKEKTAGQDIAALLSSLETHIGDLELELARANAQLSGSPRDSFAASDSPTSTPQHDQLQASLQEAQRWKTEAERLQDLLKADGNKQSDAQSQAEEQLQKLQAQVLSLTEQNKGVKLEGQERVQQLEGTLHELSKKNEELERQCKERVKQLEEKINHLEAQKRVLEKQFRSTQSSVSPANSIDALPLRASKVTSPLDASLPLQNKGVGNLIDRFGGGRKLPSDLRNDDSPTVLHACIRSAEKLRAMLPDLSTAAKGSADLHALRDAFQANGSVLNSPTSSRSPTSARSLLGSGADLQAELDAIAERLRSTLAISRTVIDLALEAEAEKENFGSSESKQEQAAAMRAHTQALSSQQALVTRITSLTCKVKEQTDRERRLKAEMALLRQQLEEAHNVERAPSSPSGLTLGNGSMLGLSTSPARASDASLLGCSKNLGQRSSNKSLRTLMGEKASPTSLNAHVSSGASLAPPRSPSALDAMPSPTKCNVSANSSPSIRYIPPFAPPSMDGRTHQRLALESRNLGTDSGGGNATLSDISNKVATSDNMSLRSGSSPSSTYLGLPSSAVSLADTSQSSASAARLGVDPQSALSSISNGMLKRTITLGMDVPQLVSRVRELERQLAQTASIRQRAERVTELELELRQANQAYSKLLDRMDAERDIDTHQKVDILNELNDAQSKLQTTQVQIQRAQSLSPYVSPLMTSKPLPPPKD